MKNYCILILNIFTFSYALHTKHISNNAEPDISLDKKNAEPDISLEETYHPAKVTFNDTELSFGLGCPNPKKPKLAICVAGLSRKFVTNEVISRFNKHLMEPAVALGAVGLTRAEPDVFIHVSAGSNNDADMQAAVSAFHATEFEIQPGETDLVSREQDLANPKCFHPGYAHGKKLLHLLTQYKHIHACLQMIEKAELGKARNEKYDSVIFMRPDHRWALDTENFKREQHTSFGGAPVEKKIQCKLSMYAADLYSFQTRKAFQHYGNIWIDQFQNKDPSYCDMHTNDEGMVVNAVAEINEIDPGTAIYADHHIDAGHPEKTGVGN